MLRAPRHRDVGYAVLAYSAARIAAAPVVRGRGEVAEEQRQRTIAEVLTWPAGDWFVGAAGLFLLVMGVGQAVLLLRRSYTIEINLDDRTPAVRRGIHALAWYGYSARGVIIALLGYFLLRGGLSEDASKIGDTDTAFDTIGGGLIGDSAFFVVAVGTLAYGLFMYACALFYRFETRQSNESDHNCCSWGSEPEPFNRRTLSGAGDHCGHEAEPLPGRLSSRRSRSVR